MISYSGRLNDKKIIHTLGIFSGFGYATPGAVLALGIIICIGIIDNFIIKAVYYLFDIKIGLIFSGTLFMLVFAYIIRFLSIAQGTIYSGLEKINNNIDYSAKTLGCNNTKLIYKIHFPLINKSILTASLIVFVDSMKELPATLILRSFNFDTLATNIYQFVSDELLEETSLSALLIIIIGIISVILLNNKILKT